MFALPEEYRRKVREQTRHAARADVRRLGVELLAEVIMDVNGIRGGSLKGLREIQRHHGHVSVLPHPRRLRRI